MKTPSSVEVWLWLLLVMSPYNTKTAKLYKYKNYDFRTFVDQFCLSTEIDQKCHRKSKSNGGKIGRQVEYEGKIYSTCKELAETVRKSEQTINSWLKKGKARYCS